jgi:hypothetical protein
MDDDPFHISQVSGFYGPGTWASWIIALASSSISIMSGDQSIGYDVFGHLLYTHWAAIDVFRQLNRDKLSFGPLVAAIVITYWGNLHNILQFFAHSTDGGFGTAMFLGSFLPSIALFTFMIYGYRNPDSLRADLFANTPLTEEDSSALFATVHGLMIFTFVLAGIFAVVCLIGQYDEAQRGENTVFAVLLITPLLGVFVLDIVGYFLVFVTAQFTRRGIPDCHFLKPCTSQSIAEWDQAFALMCALVIFVYEKGPTLLAFARRRSSAPDSS